MARGAGSPASVTHRREGGSNMKKSPIVISPGAESTRRPISIIANCRSPPDDERRKKAVTERDGAGPTRRGDVCGNRRLRASGEHELLAFFPPVCRPLTMRTPPERFGQARPVTSALILPRASRKQRDRQPALNARRPSRRRRARRDDDRDDRPASSSGRSAHTAQMTRR